MYYSFKCFCICGHTLSVAYYYKSKCYDINAVQFTLLHDSTSHQKLNNQAKTGPALMTSSVASSAYFLKFSRKRPPSLVTSALKFSSPWVHAFLGFRSSDGTPGHVVGTARLNVSYVSNSTFDSSPEWMASRIARVYFSLFFLC